MVGVMVLKKVRLLVLVVVLMLVVSVWVVSGLVVMIVSFVFGK